MRTPKNKLSMSLFGKRYEDLNKEARSVVNDTLNIRDKPRVKCMKVKDITRLMTIGSQYDNNSVMAVANGKDYRIRSADLVKMLASHPMKKLVEVAAIKHTYLELK